MEAAARSKLVVWKWNPRAVRITPYENSTIFSSREFILFHPKSIMETPLDSKLNGAPFLFSGWDVQQLSGLLSIRNNLPYTFSRLYYIFLLFFSATTIPFVTHHQRICTTIFAHQPQLLLLLDQHVSLVVPLMIITGAFFSASLSRYLE